MKSEAPPNYVSPTLCAISIVAPKTTAQTRYTVRYGIHSLAAVHRPVGLRFLLARCRAHGVAGYGVPAELPARCGHCAADRLMDAIALLAGFVLLLAVGAACVWRGL